MYKDKEKLKEYQRCYQRERQAKRRAVFFKDKECVKCGSKERLELDHINPAEKESHNIWSWSQERCDKELAKCQVLCHDCHLVKTQHDKSQPLYECGTVNQYRRGCRCEACSKIMSIKRQKSPSYHRRLIKRKQQRYEKRNGLKFGTMV
jgi:hypothetical protein